MSGATQSEIAPLRCRPARAADQARLAQLWAETRRRSFHWLPADGWRA
ncbi:MAG: hypothetical protein ABI629_14200 [bacterium]